MDEVTKNANKNRKPFTKEEDAAIMALVEQYNHDWLLICEAFNAKNINGVRSYSAIRGRWRDHLNPSIPSNLPFSIEEDVLLLKKVDEIGKYWRLIRKSFPNRNMNKLKNRYIELNKNKINRRHYTLNENNKIKKLIQANPDKFDTDLAKELNKNLAFKNRSFNGLLMRIGKLRETSNPKNPIVNQNNLHQQNQNASVQPNFLFQFDNNDDNFFNQDFIPELEDSDHKYFYY